MLHWATAIAFTVSLFTGIRIAADALSAPVSKWLSPILPQGEIWTFHFYAGLTLFFCGSAYLIYMRRAAWRTQRAEKDPRDGHAGGEQNALRRTQRDAALGCLRLVVFLTCTGVLLYLG